MKQWFEQMWWNKRRKPNVILRLLSYFYAKTMRFDQHKRFQLQTCPPIPMISIGNITVGGSGKTPFVVWLAAELRKKGKKPVLLSRGDGANNQTPHMVSEYSKAREIGDEAVLLFRLTGCPVIAGRNRVEGAALAADFGDVLILDDGFQYRQLSRACDIVLVPKDGLGNGFLLPAGPLREPVSALSRADIVVRTGGGGGDPLSKNKEWNWSAKSAGIHDWMGIADYPLNSDVDIELITSVARPGRVKRVLLDAGFEVLTHHEFDDHHQYTIDEVQKLLIGNKTLVATGKDAVKLLPLWDKNRPLWVLEQTASAEQGLVEEIMTFLDSSSLDT